MGLSNEELGHYLKCLRESLGYSTYDVNKLCDISQSYLSLVENGKRKPSAVILKKLAPIYNVNYIDLYEKAGYLDLAESEKLSNSTNNKNTNNFRYANHNGINTEGLNKEEIEEINRFVEFVRNKKKNEGK